MYSLYALNLSNRIYDFLKAENPKELFLCRTDGMLVVQNLLTVLLYMYFDNSDRSVKLLCWHIFIAQKQHHHAYIVL